MADSNPPAPFQTLKARRATIGDNDTVIVLIVRPNQQFIHDAYQGTGAELKRVIDLGMADTPAPTGPTATVNSAPGQLNARSTPKIAANNIVRTLAHGTVVTLADSAPVVADGVTWRAISAVAGMALPAILWCSEKYLALTVPSGPPIPLLTGKHGICVVASGDGNDEHQLMDLVGQLRSKGKVLPAACIVQNAGLANALRGVSPQTFLVYRYIPMISFIGGVEEIGPGHPSINYDARKFWDMCWPECWKVPNADAWQLGDNESDPDDLPGFTKWCQWISDTIDIADAHPAKPRLALFNFGVGHPKYEDPAFKAVLDPVMRKAAKRHIVNAHCYSPTSDKDPAGPKDIEASFRFFAGRIFELMAAHPDALVMATEYGLAWGDYPGREIYQANVGKFMAHVQAWPRFLAFMSWMIPRRPNEPGVWRWEEHAIPIADFVEIA